MWKRAINVFFWLELFYVQVLYALWAPFSEKLKGALKDNSETHFRHPPQGRDLDLSRFSLVSILRWSSRRFMLLQNTASSSHSLPFLFSHTNSTSQEVQATRTVLSFQLPVCICTLIKTIKCKPSLCRVAVSAESSWRCSKVWKRQGPVRWRCSTGGGGYPDSSGPWWRNASRCRSGGLWRSGSLSPCRLNSHSDPPSLDQCHTPTILIWTLWLPGFQPSVCSQHPACPPRSCGLSQTPHHILSLT